MVTSDQDRFSLQDYLSRGIAGDDGITSVELKPMRESDYIRLPYNQDINERSLRLCSWNVHVTTSYLDILELIDQFSSSLDTIGLCETFLSSNQSISLYSFPGYDLRIKNRVLMGRGGVGFLVKNGLNYQERDDLSIWMEGKVEVFSIEIEFDGKKNII